MISPTNQTIGSTNIIRIRGGIEGANNYPLAPGYTAMLLDEESNMFFIKGPMQNGMTGIEGYKYEKLNLNQNNGANQEYATKEDFNMLMEEIKKLQSGSRNNNQKRHNNYRRNYGNGKSYDKSI